MKKNQPTILDDRAMEECGCHHKAAHWGQHSDCRQCGEYLVEQAEAWMQAENAEDFLTGFFAARPSSAENFALRGNGASGARNLFDHHAFGKSMPSAEPWADQFDVVASPKSPLPESLLPGDLLLSRSFGEGKAWEAVAVSGELFSREQATARGLYLDSAKPGVYLEVATVRPIRRQPRTGFAKRVGDEWGRLLPDSLILRRKPVESDPVFHFPGSSAPISNGGGTPDYSENAPAARQQPKMIWLHDTDLNAPYVGGNFDFLYNAGSSEAIITFRTYLNYVKNYSEADKRDFVSRLMKAADTWDGAAEVQIQDAKGNWPVNIKLRFKVEIVKNPDHANKKTDVFPSDHREKVIRDFNVNIDSSFETLAHELGHVWGLEDEYDAKGASGWLQKRLPVGHVGPDSPFLKDKFALMNQEKGSEFRGRYFRHFGRKLLEAFEDLDEYKRPDILNGKVVATAIMGRIKLLKRDIDNIAPPFNTDVPPFNPQYVPIRIARQGNHIKKSPASTQEAMEASTAAARHRYASPFFENNPAPIFTVLDADARLRTAQPALAPTGKAIPQYTQVVILQEHTKDAEVYAEVREALPASSPSLGWTLKSNLEPNVDWVAFKQALVRTANAELTAWTTPPPVKQETNSATFGWQKAYWSIIGASPTDTQLGSIDWQDGPIGAGGRRHGGHYWSAVFISWCVKQAGAGRYFSYSDSHSNYIVQARNNRRNGITANPFWAYGLNAPEAAWLEAGDIVCMNRDGGTYTLDSISRGNGAHCDIVVAVNRQTRQMETIGGNVDDRVAKTIVMLDDMGHIDTAQRWSIQGTTTSGSQRRYFALIKVRTGSNCLSSATTQAESLPDYPAEISTRQNPVAETLEPGKSGGEPCPAGSQKVTTQAVDYTIVACQKPDGTLHGSYLETWKNGKKKAEGKYEQGRLSGKWSMWHENGQIETEMEFANGKEEGAYKKWFDNGKPYMTGAYRQGKKEGVWVFADSNGQKRAEGRYFDGLETGTWQTWHNNGQLASKCEYDKGELTGKCTTWHDNGKKESEGNFAGNMVRKVGRRVWKMPKRVELWAFWHPNGQKNKEGTYKGGFEEGTWNYWNNQGKIARTATFKQGVLAEKSGRRLA